MVKLAKILSSFIDFFCHVEVGTVSSTIFEFEGKTCYGRLSTCIEPPTPKPETQHRYNVLCRLDHTWFVQSYVRHTVSQFLCLPFETVKNWLRFIICALCSAFMQYWAESVICASHSLFVYINNGRNALKTILLYKIDYKMKLGCLYGCT